MNMESDLKPNGVEKFASISLDDKYSATSGWLYMTGVQALVRLPIQQRIRDAAAGLNTGGYISGYRGSPLGRYDMELWAAEKHLKSANITFRAGLNEDLAATAIWGSQYVGTFPGATVEGVFGIWYGKGPGVDRSGDVLRHANLAGTSPAGGVLCLAGDDHGAKSSTVANFSDTLFVAVGMPVLYPSNTQEILDYGLHGIAMSRYSGCWIGMKVVTDVVEGGGSVRVAPDSPSIELPVSSKTVEEHIDSSGYHIRRFDTPLAQEERLYHHKHQAALDYARANRINQTLGNTSNAKVGIVAAGKAWQDLQQALANLGLSDGGTAHSELRFLKVGMVWPLDPLIVREFAQDLETIVVIEEKRPLIEDQLRAILYGTPSAPKLIGKHLHGKDSGPKADAVAFPNWGEISPALVGRMLLTVLGDPSARGCSLVSETVQKSASGVPARMPSFCSGCPHNRSTKVPEGSRALAGIGCHSMAILANPAQTTTMSHMGGEGIMWLGQQPFTNEKHVFANLGDGTYAHSGFLAVRQAVAANVPITYKLLYNGFVSMTGGQRVDASQTPGQILAGLASEGVKKMALVTDEPSRYRGVKLPEGVSLRDRTELDAVQREFREYPGVSVILYDQACATERRRLRKRGTMSDPQKRTFINSAVCEGCGDCGTASNCMSIEPLETELGRKRRINQSSCNKDFSCVEGFCPSFVTVHGGKLRRAMSSPEKSRHKAWNQDLPEPTILPLEKQHSVLIAGIGGTGVVTVGQTLAMAAHVQGYYCSNLDVTGLAQKYGAVHSHVRIAADPSMLHSTRIGKGEANALIGCDLLVAAGDESMYLLNPATGGAVVASGVAPTSEFARNPDWQIEESALKSRVVGLLGSRALMIDAQRLATALMGDTIAANMFMLGAAWQRGLVPLKREAIERAIELNGVAIELNKEAFVWGRRAAHNVEAVEHLAVPPTETRVISIVPRLHRSLDDLVANREKHLLEHSGGALVARYQAMVKRVEKAESVLCAGDAFSRAVAHNYHRLLAVKDEWEVARLYSHPSFRESIEREFEGSYKIRFHVGGWPFGKTDSTTGLVRKAEVGPWLMSVFKLMARLKGIRGTVLDPFRNNAERKLERRLLAQYESDLETVLRDLSPETLPMAVKIASLPQTVRGYGHVKERHAEAAQSTREVLLRELEKARIASLNAASPMRGIRDLGAGS